MLKREKMQADLSRSKVECAELRGVLHEREKTIAKLEADIKELIRQRERLATETAFLKEHNKRLEEGNKKLFEQLFRPITAHPVTPPIL